MELKTVAKVDQKRRVRIPDFKPGQLVSVEMSADGSVAQLTRVESTPDKPKQRFPKGSLLKYFNAERDREETEIAKAFVQGPE